MLINSILSSVNILGMEITWPILGWIYLIGFIIALIIAFIGAILQNNYLRGMLFILLFSGICIALVVKIFTF